MTSHDLPWPPMLSRALPCSPRSVDRGGRSRTAFRSPFHSSEHAVPSARAHQVGVGKSYITSMYWALTMVMKSPWLPPQSTGEQAYCSMVIVFGAIVFAAFLGHVTTMIQSYEKSNALYRDGMTSMHHFFESRASSDSSRLLPTLSDSFRLFPTPTDSFRLLPAPSDSYRLLLPIPSDSFRFLPIPSDSFRFLRAVGQMKRCTCGYTVPSSADRPGG